MLRTASCLSRCNCQSLYVIHSHMMSRKHSRRQSVEWKQVCNSNPELVYVPEHCRRVRLKSSETRWIDDILSDLRAQVHKTATRASTTKPGTVSTEIIKGLSIRLQQLPLFIAYACFELRGTIQNDFDTRWLELNREWKQQYGYDFSRLPAVKYSVVSLTYRRRSAASLR